MSKVTSVISKRILTTAAAIAISVVPALPIVGALTARADSSSSYVTLNSFSGHPDTTLTVSGGNYAAGETVVVSATENGSAIASNSVQASATGTFSTSVAIPAKAPQGAVNIVATGSTSGMSANNAYYVSPFNPSVSTSAGDSTPYGVLTVSGTGYDANEVVDLNFAGSTTQVTTNAMGAFNGASVTTPKVTAGSYNLIGVGEASGASATAYQYIDGFYPNASPSSYYVLPATQLGFNGGGFAPNETVNVTNATSGAAISTFTADAKGSFSDAGAFTVPSSAAGTTIKVVLTGVTSGASTSVTTNVGAYYPNVSPSAYYVLPGSSVTFNGSGFMPNETVDVLSGTTTVATGTTDQYGNLTTTTAVTAPISMAGTNATYTVIGESSHGTATVSYQVGNFNPQASPSSYYAQPGSILSFTGSGFAPGETINVVSGKSTTALTTITADETGSFMTAGSVNISYAQAGTGQTYNLVGQTSNANVSLSIGVASLNAQISPSSYYVLPYQTFSVDVTGYAPGETINLYNGKDTAVFATAVADKFGAATFANLSVPASKIGSVSLSAIGQSSAATTTASIGVGNYNPSVTLSSYYARPGDSEVVTGTGFAPNEPVTLTAGTVSQALTADAMGDVTATFAIPYGIKSTTNSLDITLAGTLSAASSTTTTTLAPFTPQVSPSTYYAQPGSPEVFTGSGFVPGESIVVTLNGATVGTETADAMGNLTSAAYTLPFAKSADFTLTGQTSGGTFNASIGLAQFYAGIQLSSYYGNGGSSVVVSGSGYAPNEVVALTAGTTSLGNVTANAKGSFSQAVTIPYSAPTTVTITGTGATSGSAPATSYTVAQVYNSTTLGSYGVDPGTAVDIIGSGYMPGEPVTVTGDRLSGTYTITAGADGSFNDSGLVLPVNTTPGKLTLTITGTHSFTSTQITLYVTGA